jgi:oxygen-dependent protoporphyrinogen oxidase
MTWDVAVIGGGISGLAAAWELRRQGHRVVVLERQVRPGGNAVSTRIGGFLMEHGPSSISGTSPGVAEVTGPLGLAGSVRGLGEGVRYRYLTRGPALGRIATHPLGFLMSGYLSPAARLRLLAEPLVPRAAGGGEETVAGFVSRRFGSEFSARIMDPLVGGLLAGTAETVSMAAAFPALCEMEREHGSVARAVFKRWRAGGTMPGRRIFSWPEGMAALPRTLARDLGPAVRSGVAVRRLRPVPGGFRIEAGAAGTFEVPAVVLATQPHVAALLLEGVDEEAAGATAGIDAPPISVVFLGYRRAQVDHPLDGLGYLTPSAERRALSGALFCSTMFDGRAPEGHVALAAYIGGERAPDLARLPAAELTALARDEFGDLLGARGEPVIARTRHWPRGLPQYRPGHGAKVEALLALEDRVPGLFMTGNYFQGPGAAACLARARETSVRVGHYLRARIGSAEPGPLQAADGRWP